MTSKGEQAPVQKLQRKMVELGIANDAIIDSFVHALDLREREAEGHTHRVAELTIRFARFFYKDESQLIHIRNGALLHDIGKMGIPESILIKPAPLNEDEWTVMRKHPQYAYDLLSPVVYLHDALDIPMHHHEKWDGSGYPQSLKGEEIPLAARIFAVVDVYDALTSNRPYRSAWAKAKALEYIESLAGSHFDNQVVKRFLGTEILSML